MLPLRSLVTSLVLLAVLSGCGAGSPRFPGPLGPVAHTPPSAVHVTALPAVEPSGTADVAAPPQRERAAARSSGTGEAIADAARHYLTHAPTGFRDDCSGFVMAAYDRAGHPVSGNSRSFWDSAEAAGSTFRKDPAPGDLAFFDDTYDRNHNGRRDDPLTHVAVVIEVERDGTIVMAHGGTSKGRTTLRMNLHHPHDRVGPDGTVWNDWLRARGRGEPEGAAYLAGELFRGFARAPG